MHPIGRRPFLLQTVAMMALLPQALRAQTRPRIGVIGAGRIGGQLARFWAHAGYPVMVSSLSLDEMKKLAVDIGHGARAGTAREAAAFGQVIVMSVPFGALPQVGRDYAAELKGKVVLDTTNPYVSRDGDMATEAIQKGTGVVVPTYLPGVRLVRAFNQIGAAKLEPLSKATGEKTGVPLASDDAEGLRIASQMVRDTGFEPVVVGGLATAKRFDVGSPAYTDLRVSELKSRLGLK
ncbi:MAG: hypothetical protein RL274_1923 [Pseudomonadota bacterium]|jgi:predicted dinucleotide-binding enzyme